MTDTQSTNGQTNGNGNGTAEVKVSAIAKALKRHAEASKAKGGKVDKKAQGELLATFKKLLAERDKAQKAFDAATAAFMAHAEPMVLEFGDKKVSVGGRIYFPASRGDTIFYREQGKQDPDDIIEA